MPTVAENYAEWNARHAWPAHGDEWSASFGGSDRLWSERLAPRIAPYVPTRTILEIAPGHGRVTHYLRPLCTRLVLVDLSDTCIAACRDRFATDHHIEYIVNDGRTLPVPDASIDFAFSFDSLVHCEIDVIDAYLQELARVLTPTGSAFLHHSNLGAYPRFRAIERLPEKAQQIGKALGLFHPRHWRAFSVTANRVAEAARRAGLHVASQERIAWGTTRCLIDCLTIVSRAPVSSSVNITNHDFMHRAAV